jgi:hypothetical protein
LCLLCAPRAPALSLYALFPPEGGVHFFFLFASILFSDPI